MRTNQQLKDLNIPFCDWRLFLKFKATSEMPFLPQKDVDALDEYFRHFLPPNEGKCWKCGHQQGVDGVHDVLLHKGRFRFGAQHGVGQCTTGGCGWPARAIHYNVGPIVRLDMILQFHPNIVSWDL